MRKLTDINWNDTTLSTDLSDCSGIKYRFYVSNDPSGNDEEMKIAGSIDMVYKCGKTGKLHIYDWKRCKEISYDNNY